jgi:hypothetical protein
MAWVARGQCTAAARLRFARLLVVNNGMPRVAARAAVAPGDGRVTAKHLFDGHVMVGSALRAQVRNTGLFDLARGQLVQRFTGGHIESNDIMPATADFTIHTLTFGSLAR